MRLQPPTLLLLLLSSTLVFYILFRFLQGKKDPTKEEKLKELSSRFSDVEYALLGKEFDRFNWEEKKLVSKQQEIDFPLELIVDGNIIYENLNKIHKDRDWLLRIARKRNVSEIDNINYAVLDSKGRVHFDK